MKPETIQASIALFAIHCILLATMAGSNVRISSIAHAIAAQEGTSSFQHKGIDLGDVPLNDPIPERIQPDGTTIQYQTVATIPESGPSPRTRINYAYHAGDGSGRLFVNDLRGQLYTVDMEDGNVSLYLDIQPYFSEWNETPALIRASLPLPSTQILSRTATSTPSIPRIPLVRLTISTRSKTKLYSMASFPNGLRMTPVQQPSVDHFGSCYERLSVMMPTDPSLYTLTPMFDPAMPTTECSIFLWGMASSIWRLIYFPNPDRICPRPMVPSCALIQVGQTVQMVAIVFPAITHLWATAAPKSSARFMPMASVTRTASHGIQAAMG